ncbi:MAG: AmmeMemoRadiSam system protein B [Desulfovibrio sp.]|jgi:AmmeMemoRadiSam system protein B|nr:AmmeMemoRadiSam system protein B [Desulfovibrio sp.]
MDQPSVRHPVVRRPVVAGQFYPGDAASLAAQVQAFLAPAVPLRRDAGRLFGFMLPHAGYVYCGGIIGATLSGAELPKKIVILCPNHTGQGQPLGVWPDGAWLTPLGPVPVDEALAAALCATDGGYAPDVHSHLREHSIEVLLPFLHGRQVGIAPVCVGTRHPAALRAAGLALAAILKEQEKQGVEVCVVVSSDMNHYESEQRTLEKDALALEQALAGDPDGLLRVVERENITMCGAGPLALALYAANALGRLEVELARHDTSALASGDSRRVVGYAGLRMYVNGEQ